MSPSPSPSPSPGDALRAHWPLLVLVALVAWGYIDLRLELSALRAELAALPRTAPEAAPPSREPSPGAAPTDPAPNRMPPSAPEPPPETPAAESAHPLPPAVAGASDGEAWARCTATLAPEAVQQAIGAHGRTVFGCFDAAHAVDPTLQGTVVVAIRVGQDGKVDAVHVDGTPSEPALRGCIARAVASWQFAAPQGGECAVVSAPFKMAPP